MTLNNYLAIAATAALCSWGVWDMAERASDPFRFNDLANRRSSVHSSHGPVLRPVVAGQLFDLILLQGVSPATRRGEQSSPVVARQSPGRLARGQSPRSSSAERLRSKEGVAGSNPVGGTNWLPVDRGLTKAQLAAEVRAALPKLPKSEVDAAVWIMWRESSGRLNARNRRTSSHGLNGFLRSTWRNITSRSGIRHGLDPKSQILAMHRYCIDRYGSFAGARRHHESRRWY